MIRKTLSPRRRALPALLVALTALLALPMLVGSASATSVAAGQLSWTQNKIWDTSSASTVNHTWLGYLSRLGAGGPDGHTTPLAPATGPAVDSTSANGEYTWAFPSTGGTFDMASGAGTIAFTGGLSFEAVAHHFTITIENPTLVLKGDGTGLLYARGQGVGADAPGNVFEAITGPTFSFTGAIVTETDGVVTVSGLVPRMEKAIISGYGIGSGPDREPNTFGGFAVSLRLGTDGAAGPKGDPGTAGKDGVNGTNGTNGTNGVNGKTGKKGKDGTSATRVIAYLRKAPWSGNASRKVSMYRNGRIVGTGTIRSKTLNVTVTKGKRISAGSYTLKAGSSKKSIRVG